MNTGVTGWHVKSLDKNDTIRHSSRRRQHNQHDPPSNSGAEPFGRTIGSNMMWEGAKMIWESVTEMLRRLNTPTARGARPNALACPRDRGNLIGELQ